MTVTKSQDRFVPANTRRPRRSIVPAGAILALGLGLASTAQADQFTVFDVPGSAGTFPQSINADSTVTGFSVDGQGIAHGFVRSPDGTIVSFDANDPVSIDKKGWIAGTFNDHGFVRSPRGKIKKFDAAPHQVTGATAINDSKTVIGDTTDDGGVTHGFLRDNHGAITLFDAPGAGLQTIPLGLNGNGAATGFFADNAGADHGFVRSSDGSFETFDPSGSADTLAIGINAKG